MPCVASAPYNKRAAASLRHASGQRAHHAHVHAAAPARGAFGWRRAGAASGTGTGSQLAGQLRGGPTRQPDGRPGVLGPARRPTARHRASAAASLQLARQASVRTTCHAAFGWQRAGAATAIEDVKIRMGFAQVWAVGYVGSRMHGKLKNFKVTSRALPIIHKHATCCKCTAYKYML